MNPASSATHPSPASHPTPHAATPPRETKARSRAAGLRSPVAPATALPRRNARVLAPAALEAVARALFIEDVKSMDGQRMHDCAEQLRKIGRTLKHPLAPAIVRGMADRVIDTLALGKHNDLGMLVEVLAQVMGGRAMEAPALRIAAARLLEAGPRLTGWNLDTALLALCRCVGGPAMSEAHRQALLDAAIDVLEPLTLKHGFAPDDPALRPSSSSNALLRAMTDPSLATGSQQAHVDAIVQRLVAPGASGSPQARASALESLWTALSAQHLAGCRGPAYVALLRRAPAFDAALYEYVPACFNFADLYRDDPPPERALERLRTVTADMARWAVSLGPQAMRAFMAGTAFGLWNDTTLTTQQFGALLRGVLDAVGPDNAPQLEDLARGLLQMITPYRVLEAGHVDALLSIAWEMPSTLQDMRRHVLTKTLCEALSEADWNAACVMALADGLIARAQGPSGRDRYQAGLYVGYCLARMAPGDALFAQVLARLATEPAVDAACQLLAGFFTPQGSSPCPLPDDVQEFDAIASALMTATARDPVRAAAVAAQLALALGAHSEPPQEVDGWAACFRAAPDGKAGPSGASSHARQSLALGLELAISPVQAVRRAGGDASLQLDRLETACQVWGMFNAERLHQQVLQLEAMDFGADHELRAEMLVTLFQHHGGLARPDTFAQARNTLGSDLLRAPAALTAAGARARPDGKGLAPAPLPPQGQLVTLLEALYRYYVTAARPLSPPRVHLQQRLQVLERSLAALPPDKVSAFELRLVRGMQVDYRFWLEPDGPPAPGPSPSGATR